MKLFISLALVAIVAQEALSMHFVKRQADNIPPSNPTTGPIPIAIPTINPAAPLDEGTDDGAITTNSERAGADRIETTATGVTTDGERAKHINDQRFSVGQVLPGQVVPSQVINGQVIAGQVLPGQILPGQVLPGQVIPGQVLPGQVIPGQILPGQILPGQILPGQILPGQVYPGQGVFGGVGRIVGVAHSSSGLSSIDSDSSISDDRSSGGSRLISGGVLGTGIVNQGGIIGQSGILGQTGLINQGGIINQGGLLPQGGIINTGLNTGIYRGQGGVLLRGGSGSDSNGDGNSDSSLSSEDMGRRRSGGILVPGQTGFINNVGITTLTGSDEVRRRTLGNVGLQNVGLQNVGVGGVIPGLIGQQGVLQNVGRVLQTGGGLQRGGVYRGRGSDSSDEYNGRVRGNMVGGVGGIGMGGVLPGTIGQTGLLQPGLVQGGLGTNQVLINNGGNVLPGRRRGGSSSGSWSDDSWSGSSDDVRRFQGMGGQGQILNSQGQRINAQGQIISGGGINQGRRMFRGGSSSGSSDSRYRGIQGQGHFRGGSNSDSSDERYMNRQGQWQTGGRHIGGGSSSSDDGGHRHGTIAGTGVVGGVGGVGGVGVLGGVGGVGGVLGNGIGGGIINQNTMGVITGSQGSMQLTPAVLRRFVDGTYRVSDLDPQSQALVQKSLSIMHSGATTVKTSTMCLSSLLAVVAVAMFGHV